MQQQRNLLITPDGHLLRRHLAGLGWGLRRPRSPEQIGIFLIQRSSLERAAAWNCTRARWPRHIGPQLGPSSSSCLGKSSLAPATPGPTHDWVDGEGWIARRHRIDTRTFRMRNRYSRNVERKPQAARALATVNWSRYLNRSTWWPLPST